MGRSRVERKPPVDKRAARAWNQRIDKLEEQYADEVKRWMRRMARVVAQKVTGAKARKHTRHWEPAGTKTLDPDSIIAYERWAEELASVTDDFFTNLIREFGDQVFNGILAAADDLIRGGYLSPHAAEFDPQDVRVLDAIERRKIRIRRWSRDRCLEVRNLIGTMENDGATITQIAEGIRQWSKDRSPFYAERVARTEVTAGANEGMHIAAKQTGVVRSKRWLATSDDRTRESHKEISGQTVPIDAVFTNGCRWPGDELAPASETINCRCTLMYSISAQTAMESYAQNPSVGSTPSGRLLDLVGAAKFERIPVAHKGDRPGHPFRGNQHVRVASAAHSLNDEQRKKLTDISGRPFDADLADFRSKISTLQGFDGSPQEWGPTAASNALKSDTARRLADRLAGTLEYEESVSLLDSNLYGIVGAKTVLDSDGARSTAPFIDNLADPTRVLITGTNVGIGASFNQIDLAYYAKAYHHSEDEVSAAMSAVIDKVNGTPRPAFTDLAHEEQNLLASATGLSVMQLERGVYDAIRVARCGDPNNPALRSLVREVAVADTIGQWAGTSNDSDPRSLAIQEAIKAEFKLDKASPWTTSTTDDGLASRLEREIATNGGAHRKIIRAMYEETQARFSEVGLNPNDMVPVSRGWQSTPSDYFDAPEGQRLGWQGDMAAKLAAGQWQAGRGATDDEWGAFVSLDTRPASAWSASDKVARETFGYNGVTTRTYVPVRDILAVPGTGFGCLNEHEVVVLGRPHEVRAAPPSGNVSEWVERHDKSVSGVKAEPISGYDGDLATLNEDWLKTRTWDLPTDSEWVTPRLDMLRSLPCWLAAPPEVRALAEDRFWRLKGDRPGHPFRGNQHVRVSAPANDYGSGASTASGEPPLSKPDGDTVDAAWDSVLTDEARSLDDPEGTHPERYAPNKAFGVHLKVGEVETREMIGSYDERRPPRIYDVTPLPEDRSVDTITPEERAPGMAGARPIIKVVGSERPPQHLFRVMAEGEYQQALKDGYIQTRGDLNIGSDEGTVVSTRSTGGFYLPPARLGESHYRIVRIKYRDEDGWRKDGDDYVKTNERIPFDQVDLATPAMPNPNGVKFERIPVTYKGDRPGHPFRGNQHVRVASSGGGLGGTKLSADEIARLGDREGFSDELRSGNQKCEKVRFYDDDWGSGSGPKSAQFKTGVARTIADRLGDTLSTEECVGLLGVLHGSHPYLASALTDAGSAPSVLIPVSSERRLVSRGGEFLDIDPFTKGDVAALEVAGVTLDHYTSALRKANPDGTLDQSKLTDDERTAVKVMDRHLDKSGWSGERRYALLSEDSPQRASLIREATISAFVKQWSISANDNNDTSLAIQKAIEDEFKLTGTKPWEASALEGASAIYGQHGTAMRKVVRAIYDETQATYARAGLKPTDRIAVARGWQDYGRDGDAAAMIADVPHGGITSIQTRPASSFATEMATPGMFSGGSHGFVTTTFVDVRNILATPATGQGCLNENEVIVLGGKLDVRVDKTYGSYWESEDNRLGVKVEFSMTGIDVATLNEDWLRTSTWDLPTDPEWITANLDMLRKLPCWLAAPPEVLALASTDESKGEGAGHPFRGNQHVRVGVSVEQVGDDNPSAPKAQAKFAAGALTALKPKSSGPVTSKEKKAIIAKLQETPDGALLVDALKDWQAWDWHEIQAGAERRRTGTTAQEPPPGASKKAQAEYRRLHADEEKARVLEAAIAKGPSPRDLDPTEDRVLHRGMFYAETPAKLAGRFGKAGDTVSFGPASFTDSRFVAQDFAYGNPKATPVLVKVQNVRHALPIGSLSSKEREREREWIAAGDFRLVKDPEVVGTGRNKAVVVTLEPIE